MGFLYKQAKALDRAKMFAIGKREALLVSDDVRNINWRVRVRTNIFAKGFAGSSVEGLGPAILGVSLIEEDA